MYKLDGKYVNLTDHCKQVEVGVTSQCRIRLLYSSPNVAVLVEWHPVHPNVGPKMGLGGLLAAQGACYQILSARIHILYLPLGLKKLTFQNAFGDSVQS